MNGVAPVYCQRDRREQKKSLTFVAFANHSSGHRFFNLAPSRMADLPCRLVTRLGNMRFLPAMAATDQSAFRVQAPELLVLLHWGVLLRIRAEWASLEVLDAGHAENRLLLNGIQGNGKFGIQKQFFLVLGEGGIASVHRHAFEMIFGEPDLTLCHAPRATAAKPMGDPAVAVDHYVTRQLVEAASTVGEASVSAGTLKVLGFFLLLSLLFRFLGGPRTTSGAGCLEFLESILLCVSGTGRTRWN